MNFRAKRCAVRMAIVALCALMCLPTSLTACTGKTETADDAETPTVTETKTLETEADAPTEVDTLIEAPTEEPTEVDTEAATEEVMSVRDRTLPADLDNKVEEEQLTVILTAVTDESVASCDDLTTATLTKNNWSTPYGGKMTVETEEDGNNFIRFTGMSQNWHSPAFNIYPLITEPGTYVLSFRYKFEGELIANRSQAGFVIRGNKSNNFLPKQGSNVYADLGDAPTDCVSDTWYTATFTVSITASDIAEKDTWNLCFHEVETAVTALCIDDMIIYKQESGDPAPFFPTEAQTWLCNEMVLNASVKRDNSPFEAELDLVLTCGDTTLTVPGFWDGGNTWRIRFALPTEGKWTWTTVCSDTSDTGLHGLTGTVTCTKYDGDLAVYQHGFVTSTQGNRYFTYADGTPFLYLGDTHWNLPTEEYDSAGGREDDVETDSHFKYIVKKRVEQGFTVYQSEPIGASFDLSNGITEADVEGFKSLDKYFDYIARAGLVHANAEFCYPGDLESWFKKSDFDETFAVAARYWVARYGAYPVIWTLGQETDKNFYSHFTTEENPYITLCELIDNLDAYNHPMTAHQENVSYTKCLDSSFRTVSGHSFYGVQWSPSLTNVTDYSIPKEYWENSDGKLSILYESLYDHLWTNHYGARAQGWIAYLNGMFGYGYGCEDIWLYKSSYDMDTTSEQHSITVTPEDKQVHWGTSVNFESAWQVGYMGDFFSNIEWWNLTPRFDDTDYFKAKQRVPYACASNGNDVYVIYLYGLNTDRTGTVASLDTNATYTLRWFNPRTGEWGETQTITAPDGTYDLGTRPSKDDWVVLIRKCG